MADTPASTPPSATVDPSLLSLRDFEPALQELETLVQFLERGETTLENALSAFERGVVLTRSCQRLLDQAEQRVRLVLAEPSDTP